MRDFDDVTYEDYLAEKAMDEGWDAHCERFWTGQIPDPHGNVEYGYGGYWGNRGD